MGLMVCTSSTRTLMPSWSLSSLAASAAWYTATPQAMTVMSVPSLMVTALPISKP